MRANSFLSITRDLVARARGGAHATGEAFVNARALIARARALIEEIGRAVAHAAGELANGTRRLPPERTGAIGGAIAALALTIVAILIGLHRERLADEARAIAAGEHPSQQPAAVLPEPVPETSLPTPPLAPAPEAAPAAPPPKPLPQMGESFLDRFDSADLDQRWFVSDGWSNGDWMENDWRKSQLSLTPEGLRITLAAGPPGSDKPFASGELRTYEEFRYGYFEVRMRLPRGPGLVSGAFTYSKHTEGQRPNEIDIEILGRSTDKLETTLHENGRATSKKISLPFDAADGFHTYGFDWQPAYVRWYADGMMVHEEASLRARNLRQPQQFILMLWASRQLSSWVGELNAADAPWTLDFACVGYAPKYEGRPICG
jgi:endo-1,3-1,4-beta-glycanase ExoK